MTTPPRARVRADRSPYLQKILNAQVYEVARQTPLERAPALCARLNNAVWLKREDTQPVVFSFKLRGAYNKMRQLSQAQLARGVICASAGNHAQGVALGAKQLKCQAVIVMPVTTPELKVQAVLKLGAKVILHGESYSDAYLHALELEKKHGLCFVHPFDDPEVIAGQGTVALEMLRQHPGPIDIVFVAVGGGGLIAGMAAYIKAVRPETKVIGVQTLDSNAMSRSVKAGKRVQLSEVGLFSDGTAVKLVGQETFRLVRLLVDDFIEVDTDALCAAIKDIHEETRCVVEPAGALGLAGLKQYVQQHKLKGKTLMTVTCGANMNFDRLRFVAERAEVGEEHEALFAVTIPETRGSFKHFCELIGQRSVTEFNYRICDAHQAHVFVGLSISQSQERDKISRSLNRQGFATIDFTHDELAHQHLRHMVGGRSPLAQNERLYRFIFPERPGALMRFLSSLHPQWNISLFHYRNQGADYGRILVGLQVPKGDEKALKTFLKESIYPFVDETDNPVYRLFLV